MMIKKKDIKYFIKKGIYNIMSWSWVLLNSICIGCIIYALYYKRSGINIIILYAIGIYCIINICLSIPVLYKSYVRKEE